MKFGSTGLIAVLLGSAAVIATAPANAGTSVSVSIGSVGVTAYDGCDDYYDPPWGYPDDYCDYDVWDEPIYVGGVWYNGPVYWRMRNGARVFWINGRWRRHEWVGPLPVFRWGSHGFVTWHGKSHFGKHVWVHGGHNNWHPKGGHGHGHDHHGHDHHGHDHHGHDHHGHDHHGHDHHGHDHHGNDHHGHDHHGNDHHGHDHHGQGHGKGGHDHHGQGHGKGGHDHHGQGHGKGGHDHHGDGHDHHGGGHDHHGGGHDHHGNGHGKGGHNNNGGHHKGGHGHND